jgi:hypothetical protein
MRKFRLVLTSRTRSLAGIGRSVRAACSLDALRVATRSRSGRAPKRRFYLAGSSAMLFAESRVKPGDDGHDEVRIGRAVPSSEGET